METIQFVVWATALEFVPADMYDGALCKQEGMEDMIEKLDSEISTFKQ